MPRLGTTAVYIQMPTQRNVTLAASMYLAGLLFSFSRRYDLKTYETIAGCFIMLSYVLWLATAGVFWQAFTPTIGELGVFITISLASVILIRIIPALGVPTYWFTLACSTLLLPGIWALSIVSDDSWSSGLWHNAGFVLYLTTLLFAGTKAWCWHLYLKNHSATHLALSGIMLATTWLFSVIVSWRIWETVFIDDTLSSVATYVSWLLLSYLLISICFYLKTPYEWVITSTTTLALPLIASLPSIGAQAWQNDWLHPEAIGLYLVTTILCLLSITFWKQTTLSNQPMYRTIAQTLAWVAGSYAVMLVWQISQAVVSNSDLGVTIALFVYTISGLGLFVYGKKHAQSGVRLAGILLLALVIGRLGLVEVWTMEVLWRIVTFIGIGALFMVTALLETSIKSSASNITAPTFDQSQG